jgi:spermidine/putrescine transport system ATP-binding protein
VTQDQEEALTMSDRIAVMDQGRIEQCAGPEEVYERPSTTFVAGFIGVSNLMPAVASGGREVKLDNGPTVTSPDAAEFSAGERCFAVVRPEKLEVSVDGAPSDLPSVEGVVEASLFLGTATQMAIRVADDVKITVLVPNASESERQALPGGGSRVHVSWEPQHMHLVTESPSASEAPEQAEATSSEPTREGETA